MGWESKVQNLLGHCTRESTFGIEVTHRPAAGGAQTLFGVWSDTYESVSPEDGIAVMSSDPNIGFRLSDLTLEPEKGDIIVKANVRYIVRAVEPDGEGGVTLVLEKEKLL